MKTFAKLSVLLFSLFLLGCESEDDITEIPNPEIVAVEFFNALYNERNVKKAASVCSPALARIVMHYHSPEAVARHLFNMQYDQVKITPDDSGVKVREQFKDNATVTLYFEGTYLEEKHRDVKRVAMLQVNGKWVIDKILKDPF
ncbi:hypothetical protein LP316_10335 [Thalassotalea sp. LPB0316]|uniref:hypothetical protein n=1 Tax=Thalassotalea sp. LPB0316 TaxID=2769490 RepID=UPI001868F529|nr:hypothetical protein [Thalassotalea sp. LPB0316]QOL24727.1 hypothetical protein LP316_10335 [Thalassotalea sp. LPB0316]